MVAPGGTGPIGPFPPGVDTDAARDDYDRQRRRVLWTMPYGPLDDAEFKGRLDVEDELSDEEREEVAHAEAMFRAIGLQCGSGRLLDQVNTLNTQGIAAFHDPDAWRS